MTKQRPSYIVFLKNAVPLFMTFYSLIACGNINGNSSQKRYDQDKAKTTGGKGDTSGAQDGVESGGGFLTDEDFTPGKTSLSKEKLKSYINFFQSGFEHLDSAKIRDDQDEDPTDCSKKIFKNLKITTTSIIIDSQKIACSPNPDDPSVKQTTQIKVSVTCDKEAFKDITADRFPKETILNRCQDGKVRYFLNAIITLKSKDGTSKYSDAVMTRDGKPCTISTKKTDFMFEDGCMFYTRKEGDGEKIAVRGEYRSAGGSFKKPFLTKGSLELSLNNWKGSVKLSGDDPSVTLTSSKGDKVKGNWSDLTSRGGEGETGNSEKSENPE